jgi:GNAT superfamily N-acetyltransferase
MQHENVVLAERAEREALADLYRAATPEQRSELGLELHHVGGALASMARHQQTILVNRVVGLGIGGPAQEEEVREIAARYANADIERYFLHLDPYARPQDLPSWLTSAGLSRYQRSWAKFERGSEPLPAAQSGRPSPLEVRPASDESAADFGRIAAAGFGLTESWAPVLARLVGRPGWHVYLSYSGDSPAGCAAMRVADSIAWCDWAATLQEYRGRGSQGALLRRRISDAVSIGCRRLVTCTGEEVPGEPQPSYRNILRAGFQRTHSRENWVTCEGDA